MLRSLIDLAKQNPAGLLIGCAALLAALNQIYMRGLKPLAKFWRRVAKIHEVIENSWPTLQYISENLKPNGGSSLRDAIDRIERNSVLSNQRINALLQISDKAMYECSVDGLCVSVNRAWCEITGLYPHEASGNGWANAIHEDDRTRVMQEWANAVKFERDFDMEFRYRTGIKVASHCSPLRSGGKVIGYIGVSTKLA